MKSFQSTRSLKRPKLLIAGDSGTNIFQFRTSRHKNPTVSSEVETYVGAALAKVLLNGLLESHFEINCWDLGSSNSIPPTFEAEERRGKGDTAEKRYRIFNDHTEFDHQRASSARSMRTCPDYKPTHLYILDAGGGFARNSDENFHQMMKDLSRPNSGAASQDSEYTTPRIFVHICGTLPPVDYARKTNTNSVFVEPLWAALETVKHNVTVICSASPIRAAGSAVSRRLSWEQTLEDMATDLFLFDQMRALSRFKQLIIRFGHVGIAQFELSGRSRTGNFVFSPYAEHGIFRDPVEDGRIIGKNILVVAAMLSSTLPDYDAPPLTYNVPSESFSSSTISEGGTKRSKAGFEKPLTRRLHALASGMRATMKFYNAGYNWNAIPARAGKKGIEAATKAIYLHAMSPEIKVCLQLGDGKDGYGGDAERFVAVPIPCDVLRRPAGSITGQRSNWEILRDQINADFDGDAGPGRLHIGEAIVCFGHQAVLNRRFDVKQPSPEEAKVLEVVLRDPCRVSAEEPGDHVTLPPQTKPLMPDADRIRSPRKPLKRQTPVCIATPVHFFGSKGKYLITVEREDIESFRSIRNLMKRYTEDFTARRKHHEEGDLSPLSFALFGSPGSGKSFSVKKLVEDLNVSAKSTLPIEMIEANLSQFRSISELEHLFERVQTCRTENKSIPLVFFDEFDCTFDSQPLGWLKHFLAPMQDGIFRTARTDLIVGPSIFAFAGGVYSRFAEFDPSEPPGIDHNPPDSEELRRRLELFRERKGPDFVSRLRGHLNIHSVDAADGHTKHIIRRALIIRGQLEARGNNIVPQVEHGRAAEARIDPDIVYAMLSVDRYRHGARSMQAIIQMCTPVDGGWIRKVSLPSRQQLNMHVDADEFFIRMYRSRFRPAIGRLEAIPLDDPKPKGSSRKPIVEERARNSKNARSPAESMPPLVKQENRNLVRGKQTAMSKSKK